jgi:hypothetical protein
VRHYTTNTARKAESIAYREEKLRERELVLQGINPYMNYPQHWLDVYNKVTKELVQEESKQ